MPNIIAIDGPAASGKSTIARKLADELGYLYFDTGIMYRAITWLALQRKIPVDDEVQITGLAIQSVIDVRPPTIQDGRGYDVLVDGQDITWQIRLPEVDANVSVVSAFRGVRSALTAQQRRIGLRGRVVMVGRDIGTVVLPDADLKIYLDASVEERARRRYVELQARQENVSYDEILEKMKMRDQIDSTREVAPLRPAEDAVILDSDHLTIDQVIDKVHQLIAGISNSDPTAAQA
jgi:cytidylate kinase